MATASSGFSYASDIAPLRGDNFGSSQQLAREENAAQIAQIKQSAENQARTGSLEYERAKLALEATKRETQRDLEATRLFPEISERVSSILNDPSKDPVTQLREIETTRQKYGPTVVQNPTLNNLFNSAQTIVTTKSDSDKQREALALNFVERGDPEAIKGLYGEGIATGPAKMFYDTALRVSETSKTKGAAEIAERRGSAQFGLDIDTLKSYESALSGMKPKQLTDEEAEDVAERVRTEGSKALLNIKPVLDPYDKIELIEMFIDLNPNMDTDEGRAKLKAQPAEVLYGNALKAVKQKKRMLTPSNTNTSPASLFDK